VEILIPSCLVREIHIIFSYETLKNESEFVCLLIGLSTQNIHRNCSNDTILLNPCSKNEPDGKCEEEIESYE
jgi:hypothetical protein